MRRSITYASWAATALVVLYVAATLLPLWRTTSGRRSGAHRPTSPVVAATTPKLEEARSRPTPTPLAARATAVAYASDAFSSVAGRPTDAWIAEVASISTLAWRRHLGAAESATTTGSVTVVPSVVATFPSWAPKGSVGVTVVLRRGSALESLYVDLRLERGRYLVEATQ